MSLTADLFPKFKKAKYVVTYMPKESSVTTLIHGQPVKVSETLLKSSLEESCHVFHESERASVQRILCD